MPSPQNPVTLGTDIHISLDASPLRVPTASRPTVLVVGGGVTGLVTSWTLLDRGYKVTIVSKEWASYTKSQRLTSQIAGALWEYPPAVCGHNNDPISLLHSKKWSLQAYDIWSAIAADPELSAASGVKMRRSNVFFRHPIEDDLLQLKKMQEIQNTRIQGFYRGKELIREHNLNPEYGIVDAYEYLAPVIDTDLAMSWLMGLVEAKGAKFATETIHGDLLEHEDELRDRFSADVIVNATGLTGCELAGDITCYPIRGSLLRVINDGTTFPKINDALTIAADGTHEIVFIVPRNDNILLLGGCTEPHEWTLDTTLDSPIVKRIRVRCEALLPALRDARLDPEYPLAQGLRPFTARNVRVERELRTTNSRRTPSRIVHSYGQGCAGWSLSFGCAGDVACLVEEALYDLPPKEMAARKPTAINVEGWSWARCLFIWRSMPYLWPRLLAKMKRVGPSPQAFLSRLLHKRH